MTTLAAAIVALLIATTAILGWHVVRLRRYKREAARRMQRLAWPTGPWELPAVRVEELDEVFALGPFGPTLASEVRFIGMGTDGVHGGTSLFEAWILAVLATRSRVLFEFGTCTGKTTYHWARNSPPDARVTTLTLPPDAHALYRIEAGDDAPAVREALDESCFSRFLYTGTDVEHKVRQLYGDSKAFDETPFLGRCDLVFVDGSHAYSYVMSDSTKAIHMVRQGGLVLWHDYAGPDEQPDVYRALNELARTLPLRHIVGTRLVAYRRP